MAGDWIKMRGNLWDDPRVTKLCDITGQTEAAIVGGLYWLWATADQHTEDGCMPGLTLRQIDRKTGIDGFGAALVEIGWLRDDPRGVMIHHFTEHNGASAKRRCMDAQRKASGRNVSASDADIERTVTGQYGDEKRRSAELEKEKRREEKKEPLREDESFARFWGAYPKKRSKGDAEKAWAKLKPSEELVNRILRAVEVAKTRDDWRKDGGKFIQYPASWLNAKGWEDQLPEDQLFGEAEACAGWLR